MLLQVCEFHSTPRFRLGLIFFNSPKSVRPTGVPIMIEFQKHFTQVRPVWLCTANTCLRSMKGVPKTQSRSSSKAGEVTQVPDWLTTQLMSWEPLLGDRASKPRMWSNLQNCLQFPLKKTDFWTSHDMPQVRLWGPWTKIYQV